MKTKKPAKRKGSKAAQARAANARAAKAAKVTRSAAPAAVAARYQRFADEYLRDFNATAAAKRAGYAPETAHVVGSRLLKNVKVAALVEAGRDAASKALTMSRDEALVRAAALARGNLASVVDWGPTGVKLKDASALTDLEKYAVAEVSELPGAEAEDGTWSRGSTFRAKMRDPWPPLLHILRVHGVAPPPGGAAFIRTGGHPAGILLDGTGNVEVFLPDNGRNPELALSPPSESENGGPPPATAGDRPT